MSSLPELRIVDGWEVRATLCDGVSVTLCEQGMFVQRGEAFEWWPPEALLPRAADAARLDLRTNEERLDDLERRVLALEEELLARVGEDEDDGVLFRTFHRLALSERARVIGGEW